MAAGLRVYTKQTGWAEEARDEDYGGDSYGADFASDGRLATTSDDGKIRVYTGDLRGTIRPGRVVQAPGGGSPFGIAFSPDGARLAVGYTDTAQVDRLDARTLAPLPRPDLDGIDNGNLCQCCLVPGRHDPVRGRQLPRDGRQCPCWRGPAAARARGEC